MPVAGTGNCPVVPVTPFVVVVPPITLMPTGTFVSPGGAMLLPPAAGAAVGLTLELEVGVLAGALPALDTCAKPSEHASAKIAAIEITRKTIVVPFELPGNFDYHYVNRDAHYSGQKRSCCPPGCLGLDTDKTRIKTTRDSRVGGSLDDGSAIGEDRDLVIVGPELQDEIRMSHFAMR